MLSLPDNLPAGKQVSFGSSPEGIHIIFDTEADAIEMLPENSRRWRRCANVLIWKVGRGPRKKQPYWLEDGGDAENRS